jgi:hypothetical protein
MKHKQRGLSVRMKKRLENIPLFVKFLFLFVTAIGFFFFVFFVTEKALPIYFAFLLCFVIAMGFLARFTLGRETFLFTVKLWGIGSVIYLCIAIPYTLSGGTLSPYMELHNSLNRWLYSLLLPVRLLGVFFTGLTFFEITSPTEFLNFGTLGLWITFLFRSIEYAKQTFRETMDALRMQGEWPEEGKGFIRFREGWLTIRRGSTLAIVTFRNIILWFPWAWLNFNRMQRNLKGGKK